MHRCLSLQQKHGHQPHHVASLSCFGGLGTTTAVGEDNVGADEIKTVSLFITT